MEHGATYMENQPQYVAALGSLRTKFYGPHFYNYRMLKGKGLKGLRPRCSPLTSQSSVKAPANEGKKKKKKKKKKVYIIYIRSCHRGLEYFPSFFSSL